MLYFLINNNYHFNDFASHLHVLSLNNLALIEIPHTLDDKEHNNITVYRYELAKIQGFISQIFNYIYQTNKIDREILPGKDDILFLYTEYEILNQYIALKFKQVGARIIMIEDGGFGTYVPFRFTESESLSLREWTKKTIYRCLPGLAKICFFKLNGIIFPRLNDDVIETLCIYNPVVLKRKIPTKLIIRNVDKLMEQVPGRVIFLNEAIYQFYQNDIDYIYGIKILLAGLSRGYNEVFFKFHPRETLEWRKRISNEVLSLYSDIHIIEEEIPIETLIEKYRPTAAASYFCSALLTLADRGIEPLYLYHLIPDLQNQPVFRETTIILQELGYKFINNIDEISPNYVSGIVKSDQDHTAVTLVELVAKA